MTSPRLATVVAAVTTLTVAAPVLADDNPFFGTWKLNQARSQLTGDTMQFAAQRGGKLRFTAAGQSYTFKVNGKDYWGLMRQKVAWTKVDDRTWRAVWKLKKKPIVTETLEIAADGKTLKDTAKGSKADGTSFEDLAVYERTAGNGATLVGSWRSTKAEVSGFQTITIAPHSHGIVFTVVEFKSSCRARLDGEDYPFKGPTTPPGMTLSFRPKGGRELHVVQKQDGIPLYVGSMTVEADGRTLTWDWKPPSVNEPMKAVFDRQ